MLVRPATMADVRNIGQNMWERGVKELDALGVGPEAWLQGWKKRILLDDAVAIGDHAILGWDWPAIDVCDTSFQAAKSFELPGVGKQVTKAIRKAIPELMVRTGARLSLTHSLCVDPEAPKWFRLLGLQENMKFTGHKFGPYTMRQFFREI